MNPFTDIIIVTYDLLDRTEQCLDSILKYTKNYHLIIVDNGSEKPTQDFLNTVETSFDSTIIRNKENLGYATAINQGMQKSTAPYLVWLNNDTIVTENWLNHMVETMKKYETEKCGFVLPNSSYEVNPWLRQLITSLPNTDFQLDMILGGLTLVDKHVIDQVGYWDERFSKGYGCDEVDYWRRAQQKGWTARFSHKAFIFHRPFSTFERKFPKDWRIMYMRNKMLLKEKWGE